MDDILDRLSFSQTGVVSSWRPSLAVAVPLELQTLVQDIELRISGGVNPANGRGLHDVRVYADDLDVTAAVVDALAERVNESETPA